MKSKLGFTLVEILVVVSVVGILTALLIVGMNEARKSSRDAQRQADMRFLQNAVELYKQKNGKYPAGCRGYGAWSGESGAYACPGGAQYIVGLAPEFISVLPKDPRPNPEDVNSGYVYWVSADNAASATVDESGTAYKLIASKTVESEDVVVGSEFAPCDSQFICAIVSNSGNFRGTPPAGCNSASAQFKTSYALWGGYPTEGFAPAHRRGEEQLENTICQMP